MEKTDSELIWENYITANWGYQNYDTPTSYKYSGIPSPTKDSYYQQGKCPTSPGQGTQYVPSSDEETKSDDALIDFGTIYSKYDGLINVYVSIPKRFLFTTQSKKLATQRQFKAMIQRIVETFILKHPSYFIDNDSLYYFRKFPISVAKDKNKIYNLKKVIIIDKNSEIINRQLQLDL